MAFEKNVPEWHAIGTEPPASLKESGFTAGYKPPADIFNWFWHAVSECLAEIQEVVPQDIETAISNKAMHYLSGTMSEADDKPSYWNSLGYGIKFFEAVTLKNQPEAYGMLINTKDGFNVQQIFIGNTGKVWTRTGSNSSTTWRNGGWVKIAVDSDLTDLANKHNVLSYVLFEQIGLTIGSETIVDIASAMPANSMLYVSISDANAAIYPMTYGTLLVQKKNASRVTFDFFQKASTGRWYGVYDNTASPAWIGWKKVYTEANKPTIEEIGAAPSGYGLGESNGKVCTDCNTAIVPGFYALSGASCANAPSAGELKYGSLLVERRYDSVFQTVTFRNLIARRNSSDIGSTWSNWEYVNPPMSVGLEYRTTDRVEGKAVYKKKDSSGKIMYRLEDSDTWIEGVPGAAPAGYGLGGYARALTSADDLNSLKSGCAFGWDVSVPANAPNWGGASSYSYGFVIPESYYNTCTQVAFSALGSVRNCVQIRHCVDGTYGEWEWFNPPMVLGVEYRTTKRYNGKVVYTKLANAGALPNTSSKYLDGVVVDGCTGFVSQSLRLVSSGNPLYDKSSHPNLNVNAYYDGTYGWIVFDTSSDLSALTCYVTLEYTKD